MNKYSEWIFQYLSMGYLEYSHHFGFDDELLGGMHGHFCEEFKGTDWIDTKRDELLSTEDKLSFYWLLAHVDQETADEMLK